PSDPVTLLRGIREKVGANTKVVYAQGCALAENLPSFEVTPTPALFTIVDGKKQNGLFAEYFDNRDFKGEPAFTRIDEKVDFNWWDGAPDEDFDDDNFGVRWTGYLVAPVSGEYALGANGFNGFKLFHKEELIASFDNPHHPYIIYQTVRLEAGKAYQLKLEFYERAGDAHIQLLWSIPGKDLEQAAVEAAKKADVVIMALGLSPRLEGEEMKVPVPGFEGGDRLTLDLPTPQLNLMRKIHALEKPVVLVLLNGSALSINWANDHIPAIVEAWYPGQAAGTAIADLLFGDYNPAGRLPVTFYKSVEQLPSFTDYGMKGKTYRYFGDEPLYPFGYGLSYTRFNYSELLIPKQIKAGEDLPISVEVKNSGDMDGEEVVQVYVSDLEASVPTPIHSLAGFRRIFLKKGEKTRVHFKIKPEQLSLINENNERLVEPGIFKISVGGGQPNLHSQTTAVLSALVEVAGKSFIIDDFKY
ncbi:MAG: glycoside hydrolase family 3 C-terminal domain-containing protein, partial [bacterium]|nr:glycoside hydrolase family 3 C-terminal domain-containing protein [bacterium]